MIGDSISSALSQKALDGVWQKQKAISNNIANAETPRYKSLKVEFENELRSAVKKTQNNSMSEDKTKSIDLINQSKIDTYSTNSKSNRLDENNVDLESENIEMSKATIQYYSLVQKISGSFSRLKYAISEGKR